MSTPARNKRHPPIPMTPEEEWHAAATTSDTAIAETHNVVDMVPSQPMIYTPVFAPVVGAFDQGRGRIKVVGRDGQLGHVVQLLGTPYHQPTHLVVRTNRLFGRVHVVAWAYVIDITADQVVLRLSKREFEQRPEFREDHEIAELVEQALRGVHASEYSVDYLATRVTCEQGVVHLHGNVRNVQRRIDLEQIARGVRGVLDVHNWLVPDDALAQHVARQLKRDEQLAVSDLEIESLLGVIEVCGSVNAPMQRALATLIVQQIPGVQAVNNALNLAKPRTRERASASVAQALAP